MICILSNNPDAYFNLAAEEYLLKNTQSEVFILWKCSPTVVIGKHQNTLAEINYSFVKKNNIRVARRLTGGGAVYHDEGNMNFTVIKEGEKGKLVDFTRFLAPVIRILEKKGLKPGQGLKNEIMLGDRKISGNAEHIYKTRILHHGTLLFNSDLYNLGSALKVTPGKYHDKSVQSNRSSVTNISDHLEEEISTDQFVSFFFNAYMEMHAGARVYELNKEEMNAIRNLADEKYQTWEWIYGYSPKYRFTNSFTFNGKHVEVEMEVEQGIIKSAMLKGNLFMPEQTEKLAGLLRDKRHDEVEIKRIIENEFFKLIPESLRCKLVESLF